MDAFEVSKIMEGELIGESKNIRGFCINSKTIAENQAFVAMKGKKHDGHDFIDEAFQRGAVGFIVEKDVDIPRGTFAIKVRDSVKALNKLASWKRENFSGKVIAIAGSAGKTTTKEMVAFLLSKIAKVEKTPRNFNSQVTVPLSICNFSMDSDFWVLEFGASQKGDVWNLTNLAKPHVRAITAIGEEHLETFGCLDDVILGNGEVFHSMQEDDFAIYPNYVSHCYDCNKHITFGEGSLLEARDIHVSTEGVSFKVEDTMVCIPIPSLAIVENALCAFAILKALGINWKPLVFHLRHFKPVDGRFKIYKINHVTIIDDAYNANPISMKKALQSLSYFSGTKIALLGDMLELGKDSQIYHKQVGEIAKDLPIEFFILYGSHVRHTYEILKNSNKKVFYFNEKGEVVLKLKQILDQVKEPVVLVKGSRGMKMEDIIEELTGEF